MNKTTMSIAPFEILPLSENLVADLRSDHAGETGAVMIYRGMLAISRNADVQRFALRHIRTELRHRRFFDRWLPERHRSRLLPVWEASGWALGALAALFGARAAFCTVAAVETFVERHYQAQISEMAALPALAPLAEKLQAFCDDEIHHQRDAAARLTDSSGLVATLWARIVEAGSAFGVRVARVI